MFAGTPGCSYWNGFTLINKGNEEDEKKEKKKNKRKKMGKKKRKVVNRSIL